jgi:Tol biopolymer transport system component
MHRTHRFIAARLAVAVVFVSLGSSGAALAQAPKVEADQAENPVAAWHGATVKLVSPVGGRHTIHSYYVNNPESPDGSRVLFYASKEPSGYVGDICVLDRATGAETVLARDIHVEDAHRAACQQWISGGKRVAFHEVRDKQWRVVVVDMATLKQTVVAQDRQLGFGEPTRNELPIYGCHWNPGPYRDIELVDAETGKIRTAARIADVEKAYPEFLKKAFGEKQVSLFFPVISPDGKRAFVKLAAGNGGDKYMSKGASKRQGNVVFDLETGKIISMREQWGHPAWHPDSRRIIEMGNILIDTNDMAMTRIPNLPNLRGTHPCVSPDGKLMATDGVADQIGGKPGEWGAMIGDIRGGKYELLMHFDNSHGARSWRRNDPHPVFSRDGKRLYFNVSSGDYTQLYVAEAKSDDATPAATKSAAAR